MSEYQNNNMSGSVFKNTYKKLDKQPDYTGSAKIDDVDYKIAMWIKVKKDGQKFFSCSFQKADSVRPNGGQRQAYASNDLDDDSIPF